MAFNDIGVEVVVSEKSVIDVCNDKVKTYEFLKENGFNTAETYISIEDTLFAIKNKDISYPVIIKPRWGMGSIGVFEAENEEELKVFFRKTLSDIQNSYLKFESEDNLEESVIVQEKLKGQEYGLDVINDLNRVYQNTIVKIKHSMRSGETDCAETINNLEIKNLGESISDKLGHIGNLDVDVFLVENKPYVLEMNARFGGGYPFSHIAGVDLPKAIISWVKGKEISKSLLKEEFGVLSHKDIDIVIVENDKLSIKQLTSTSEIVELLNNFNNDFLPPIVNRVDNIKEYAEKLNDNAFVYVAKTDKNLGFATLYANDYKERMAYISFIGVHSNSRNKKIGTKLLDICYRQAKRQKMKYIKLRVQKNNFKAQKFYKKNGFVFLEETENESIYMIKEIL